MKNLFLFFFLGACFLQVHAQQIKLDSIITGLGKVVFTYEGNGSSIEALSYEKPHSLASYQPSYRQVNTYLATEERFETYAWNAPTQSWTPTNQVIDTYDGQGNKIQTVRYNVDATGAWQPVRRERLVVIDNNPSHRESFHESWDIATQTWQSERRTEMWLNPAGQATEIIFYEWINGAWTFETHHGIRYVNAYDAQGNRISTSYYSWNLDAGAWGGDYQMVYTYNPEGLQLSSDRYLFDPDSGTWNFSRHVDAHAYQFTPEGRIAESVELNWNMANAAFVPHERRTYVYDQNGNTIDYVTYDWNEAGETWEGRTRYTRLYDLSTDPANLLYSSFYKAFLEGGKMLSITDYDPNPQTNGWDVHSESFYYYSEFITDTDEAPGAEALKLFPNPAGDVLTLSANAPTASGYQITDLSGRVLQQEKSWNGTGIDVSRLAAGNYFIRLTEGNRVMTGKFVKL